MITGKISAGFAIQAINSLQKYLTEETEPEVIAIIRSVLMILNGLVARDNGQQMEKLPQDMQAMSQQPQVGPQGMGSIMGGMGR